MNSETIPKEPSHLWLWHRMAMQAHEDWRADNAPWIAAVKGLWALYSKKAEELQGDLWDSGVSGLAFGRKRKVALATLERALHQQRRLNESVERHMAAFYAQNPEPRKRG